MADDKLILRSHANEVFAMLAEAGLDLAEFEWRPQQSESAFTGKVSELAHRGTGYYFRFDNSDQGHLAKYSPGPDRVVVSAYPGGWSQQRDHVSVWVTSLKRELDAPNLWGSVNEGRALLAGGETETNHSFSTEEQQRIAASVQEIQRYVQESLGLAPAQLKITNERLQYLSEASSRMGRKDWIVLAGGALVNIVVTGAFSPGAAAELFRFAGHALSWLVTTRFLIP